MVSSNFKGLVKELRKLDGRDINILLEKTNTFIGLQHCVVRETVLANDIGAVNIFNINYVLEGKNPVSLLVGENEIRNYEISDVNGNREVRLNKLDGDTMIISI